MKHLDGLSEAQVLQGIEDVVLEKLGWACATVTLPRGIVGMIIGHKDFVNMMRTAAEGKSNIKKEEMN